MQIRDYKEEDFGQVVELLKDNSVDPPNEPDELKGPCVVAEDGEICGVMFAIAGESTRAYVDYTAIRKDLAGTRLFYRLLSALEDRLKSMGVKRYVFNVEKWNHRVYRQLYKYRKKYRIKMLNDLHYFEREM